jgi:hypothetical protein
MSGATTVLPDVIPPLDPVYSTVLKSKGQFLKISLTFAGVLLLLLFI